MAYMLHGSCAVTTIKDRIAHVLHIEHVKHEEHLAHLRYLKELRDQAKWNAERLDTESAQPDTNQSLHPAYAASPTAIYYGNGSFQACVISRESGGNSQIWNATGHYGLYQFSYSTWVAYGGPPSEFGDATTAEQNTVFYAAMATPGGADNWAPYDGC